MSKRRRIQNSKQPLCFFLNFWLLIYYRAELEFRETEKELRQKDLEIQESMIQFSVFLQDNEKKKQKAAEKITTEKKLTMEKEAEIEVKKRQYEQLKKKAERIESKKQAIMKYENFLEEVQKQNTGEFDEVEKILTRYDTLVRENQKLD